MIAPIEDVVEGTKILRVWAYHGNESLVWDASPYNPDSLTYLESGKNYWFYHLVDTAIDYQGGYYRMPHRWNSWTELKWEGGIEFVPGEHITEEEWWKWCLSELKQMGLHRVPWLCGVRKVEVVPELPKPYGDQDIATVWESESKILVKDEAPFPASIFPATILHESVHMWQIRQGYTTNENQAYSMNWLYHMLRGDDVDVFSGAPYKGARGLVERSKL